MGMLFITRQATLSFSDISAVDETKQLHRTLQLVALPNPFILSSATPDSLIQCKFGPMAAAEFLSIARFTAAISYYTVSCPRVYHA